MKQHKALSCGRFLKTEKNIRNSFFYGLSRVLHPEWNRIGLALLKYLRSLGERYLDPFFFSPGASVELLTVLPLSEKKINKRFPAIYRGSIRKWGLVFRIIRKLECVDNFQNDVLKKWQAALDASPGMASWGIVA